MKSILESKVCESIENEDVASDDEIEYENMPDLIDPISEEILDDEILKSNSHTGLTIRVLQVDQSRRRRLMIVLN